MLAVALAVALTACDARADESSTPRAEDAQERAALAGDVAGAAGATPLPEYDVATTVGALAPGFPVDVVPVAPGSQVLASSARPAEDGETTVVTLNLRSDEPVDAIVAYYAETLGSAGFAVSPSTVPSALTSLTTFVRPASDDAPAQSVAVGVFDDEDERLVTISGQVTTG